MITNAHARAGCHDRYFDLSAAKKAELPQLDWDKQYLLG
jgi:hypothetical protein